MVLKASLANGLLKFANAGLGFGVAVFLARGLGAEGYGIYSTAFVIASVCAILAQFGLRNLVVRETAAAESTQEWGRLCTVWTWASRRALLFSMSVVVLGAIVGILLRERYTESQLWTYFLALALVPLLALGALRAGALQGLRKVVLAQLPEMLVKPGLMLVVAFALALGWPLPAQPAYAMAGQLIAVGGAFALGAYLLRRARSDPAGQERSFTPPSKKWWFAALSMAFAAGMNQINNYADILVLGVFHPAEEIGLYRVAFQTAMLVVFGLQIVGSVTAPHFARLHAENNFDRLQAFVTLAARFSFFFALTVACVWFWFGSTFLSLVFGRAYMESQTPLQLLLIGQVVNAFFGPIGLLMNMIGYEKYVARLMFAAAMLNLILNFLLVPTLGSIGAAAATAITLTVWNTGFWYICRTRAGIDSQAFAGLRKCEKPRE